MSEYPQQPWQPTNPPAPQAPKQSWFSNHKILATLLGGVLVLFLCCGGFGVMAIGGDTSGTATGTSDSAEPAAPGEGSAEASQGDASSSPAEEEAEPEQSVPGIGTPVRDGKFEFTVTKVETRSTIGDSFMQETADGKYVLVHLTVKNIGNEPQTLFDSEQKVLDASGREFSTSSDALLALEENVWLEEINPGNTIEGVLVYDMPKDTEPAEIELHDSMFSGGVTVSLEQ